MSDANQQYKRILFLCTGNYYRSRFAEELFNQRTGYAAPGWRASSRALAIERGAENVGPISEFTVRALAEIDIILAPPIRFPVACTVQDLEQADLVIAMKESEHRALMRKKFSAWEERVTYWNVHDLDVADFAEMTKLIEVLVDELILSVQRRLV